MFPTCSEKVAFTPDQADPVRSVRCQRHNIVVTVSLSHRAKRSERQRDHEWDQSVLTGRPAPRPRGRALMRTGFWFGLECAPVLPLPKMHRFHAVYEPRPPFLSGSCPHRAFAPVQTKRTSQGHELWSVPPVQTKRTVRGPPVQTKRTVRGHKRRSKRTKTRTV